MADNDEQQVVLHSGDETEAMEKLKQKRKELQKAVVHRAELEGTEDDLVLAQKTWLGMHGPVIFNVWQSLYFGLLSEGWQDGEKPVDEENASLQKRLRKSYDEMSTQLYGLSLIHI